MSRMECRRLSSALLVLFVIVVHSASEALAQACTPPPDSILSWWSLDEVDSAIAEDRVGGFNGAHTNGPVPAVGNVRGSLQFDSGNRQFVTVQDDDRWAFGADNFTIEFWASFDTNGGGSIGHPGDIFIGNDEGGGTRNKWFFALGGGVLNFHINGPSVGSRFFPRVPFQPVIGEWYHLAITREATEYTIYVDGDAEGSATDSRLVPNANAPLTIGQAENLGFIDGRLDEVTLYSRALSAEEIRSIFEAGSAGKCVELNIRPDRGGDTGTLTVTLTGANFEQGAGVTLRRAEEADVIGEPVAVEENGKRLTASFDLRGRANGLWDVVVENPSGETLTLIDGFLIEPGRRPEIVADIVGLPVIRPNREQKYWIFLSNTGNVDAVFTNQFLLLGTGVFSADGELVASSFAEIPGNPISNQENLETLSAAAAATQEKCDVVANKIDELVAELADLNRRLQELIDALNNEEDEDEKARLRQDITAIEKEIKRVKEILQVLREWFAANCPPTDPSPDPITDPVVPIDPIITPLPITVPGTGCYQITPVLFTFPVGGLLSASAISVNISDDGIVPTSGGDKEICTVASFDPNDKLGTEGAGTEGYIRDVQRLNYTVFFENLETATAPAQEVLITDQLDLDLIEVSTFALGPITFGDKQVIPPNGVQNFATTVDLRPDNELLVQVEGNLDLESGLITWRFVSLDPETGELPEDPLAGFLPPNVNPPAGEGSVLFSVAPAQWLATGTEIQNGASIVFDLNEPIVTPDWVNTVDNSQPVSEVLPLPDVQASESFEIAWNGTDEGAGIRGYTVFVSVDGGEFAPFLENTPETSATFTGDPGRQYGFFSIARDLAGNVEASKEVAEALTKVILSATGDLDGDGDVDRDDMDIILAARNEPASGPDDPRDLDGDGVITVLDARQLVLLCTRPRCATG